MTTTFSIFIFELTFLKTRFCPFGIKLKVRTWQHFLRHFNIKLEKAAIQTAGAELEEDPRFPSIDAMAVANGTLPRIEYNTCATLQRLLTNFEGSKSHDA